MNSSQTEKLEAHRAADGALCFVLAGDWSTRAGLPGVEVIEKELSGGGITGLAFDASKLGRWDSGLVAFLFRCYDLCEKQHIDFRLQTLPTGVTKLLRLAHTVPEKKDAARAPVRTPFLQRVGESGVVVWEGATGILTFMGQNVQTFVKLLLEITPALYLSRTVAAINLVGFLLGVFKGAFFGAVVAPNPYAPPPVFHQLVKRYTEIPTEPTQIQQLFNTLASLDIKSIETNLNVLFTRLDSVLGGLRTGEINAGITNVILSAQQLITAPEITNSLVSLRATLDQYRALGEKLNARVDPLADSATKALAEASRALAQVRSAAENLRTLLAPDSPLRDNLDQTLEQLAGAGQSFSALADFLKQHPNALITGRQNEEKHP